MMEEVVILAGGVGSRLEKIHGNRPKTLITVDGKTILSRIVRAIDTATNGRFRIVIAAGGYYNQVETYCSSIPWFEGRVLVVNAERWQEGNAATLLAARESIDGDEFIVQMSDHLFSPDTYQRCINDEPAQTPYVCAQPLTDGIPQYLDLEDATKIEADSENRVVDIGKKLPRYNMIDMGVFRLNRDAFDVVAELKVNQKTLSNYVARWRESNDFFVKPLPNAVWKDVDSPNDLEWAHLLAKRGLWDQ